ncbi:MAG: hypothetical protein MJZ77_03115 [Bacteroidales bacterium]|nr:hypothetical protein [Bacteroidales bacterium]
MNTSISTTLRQMSVRTIVVDALLLTTACLVPTLSHLFAFPLYHLNPMLLVLLAGMLLVPDKRNALLLALLLPLVSMMAVGMPTPLKALCMMAELSAVVLISGRFSVQGFVPMLLAIIGGKVVYYLLKALLLAPAVLVSTPVLTQLIVAVAAAMLFALLSRKAVR